jgi:hypothetical protein
MSSGQSAQFITISLMERATKWYGSTPMAATPLVQLPQDGHNVTFGIPRSRNRKAITPALVMARPSPIRGWCAGYRGCREAHEHNPPLHHNTSRLIVPSHFGGHRGALLTKFMRARQLIGGMIVVAAFD